MIGLKNSLTSWNIQNGRLVTLSRSTKLGGSRKKQRIVAILRPAPQRSPSARQATKPFAPSSCSPVHPRVSHYTQTLVTCCHTVSSKRVARQHQFHLTHTWGPSIRQKLTLILLSCHLMAVGFSSQQHFGRHHSDAVSRNSQPFFTAMAASDEAHGADHAHAEATQTDQRLDCAGRSTILRV